MNVCLFVWALNIMNLNDFNIHQLHWEILQIQILSPNPFTLPKP